MTLLERYYQWKIDRRIACWQAGYPFSEALYGTVCEYLRSKFLMPIRTPAHKQTMEATLPGQVVNPTGPSDKALGVVQPGTLGEYLQEKYPEEIKPKKTFDEWMDQEYVTLNGTIWTRRKWWGENSEAILAAKYAWEEARK